MVLKANMNARLIILRHAWAIALCAIFASLGNDAANSATISVSKNGPIPIVTITGPLVRADGDNFASTISGLDSAVVAFSSPGGDLLTGLRIGSLIRLKRFASLVPDG